MRRAVALMSVLIVLTLAALAGTGAMLAADGSVATARGTLHRAQGRALAWSGVQAVMQEIAGQRDDLLLGATPRLTTEWTVYDSVDGRGVVRLLPVDGGEVAASECAKVDVNTADEASLAKLPGVGAELAAGIVAARKDRVLSSPESLLRVKGVTAEMLFGGAAVAAEPEGSAADGETAPLLDLVTVFAFDPNVQCGVGDGGEAHRGKLRINLNSGWSDDLGKAIEERFGEGAAKAVKGVMDDGTKFESDGAVVAKLIELKAGPEAWAPILDAFTTTDEPYLIGRVDVMQAGEEALACVPGIDAAAARAIVGQRAEVPEEERLSPTWLVTHDILTPKQYEQAADHLTTRSMVWRVRVEAGIEPAGSDEGDAPVLADRVVMEAVIDVSSRRPRVAYLRDVTNLDGAWAMRSRLPEPKESEPAVEETPEPERAQAGPPKPDEGFDFNPGGSMGDEPKKPAGAKAGGGAPKAPGTGGAGAAPGAKESRPAGSGPDRRTGRWTTGAKQGGTP